MSENGSYEAKIVSQSGGNKTVYFCAGSECEAKRKILENYPKCRIENIYPILRPDYEDELYKKYHEIDVLKEEVEYQTRKKETIFDLCKNTIIRRTNHVHTLQSTITAQEEKIKRYQALMTKHILGKCPQCNYMASWPVCTKCGTPYPDGMNELGEK